MYKDISHIEEVISSFSTVLIQPMSTEAIISNLRVKESITQCCFPVRHFPWMLLWGQEQRKWLQDAPVIVKGRLIEGVGGGVCQVTSTLYVAVLKAKLEVVERVKHSMPLGYVEPGQDATISEGYIDFKFRNNTDRACLISASVVGNRIDIKLLEQKEIQIMM